MLVNTKARLTGVTRAVFLVVFCLLWQSSAAAPIKEVRRVLVFYEWSLSGPGIARVDRAIRDSLSDSPYQIELYSENLETILFPNEASQRELREWYIHKYRDHKPDVIIAEGPPSIEFAVDSRDRFFPNVPIVFCCSFENQADNPKLDSHFAGTWMALEPAKTLEVALQLQHGTKHVVVVGGVSSTDRPIEAVVRKDLRSYEATLEFTYLTDLDVPTLIDRLKQLPKNTIILYTSLSQDAAGTPFIDATQVLPTLASAANAPVFVLADSFIGRGTVGGCVVSYEIQGRITAEIASKILQGQKPQDIPIVRDTSAYMFDWRAMQRWGFKEKDLPLGSIVLNRQSTIWDAYKKYIIAAILLCLAETILVLGLLWQRARRRRIEKSLVERLTFESLISDLSTTFINLSEEQIDPNIEKSLDRIGRFLKMDRIAVFEFSRDGNEVAPTATWFNEEGRHGRPSLRVEQWPWWATRVVQGVPITCSDPRNLPDEASFERDYLLKNGVRSIATVPLGVGGEIIGAVSFITTQQEVIWIESMMAQLTVLAEIFSNAIKRKRVLQALLAGQAVLRESEERFRLVANGAPVLIWMSGADEWCTFFNQGWLDFTGRTLEQELGRGWLSGVHADDLDRCLDTYVAGFTARKSFEMEYRLRRFDGKYRWIVDCGMPRFGSDGSFQGYIGSAMDITDRKDAEQSLLEMSGRLINSQEEERARIARELHDDLSQRMALLNIDLEQFERGMPGISSVDRQHLHKIAEVAAEVSSDIHNLSHQLHSSKLDTLGLVAAVGGFCREISRQYALQIEFAHHDIPKTIPKDVTLCLFRIAQEALRNVVKHSGASTAKLELSATPNEIYLRVSDSGLGFEPESAAKVGIGLISMRERLRLVRGHFSIESEPEHGTRIQVRIPFEQI
jgi:PAS domain S-box-containing protein